MIVYDTKTSSDSVTTKILSGHSGKVSVVKLINSAIFASAGEDKKIVSFNQKFKRDINIVIKIKFKR